MDIERRVLLGLACSWPALGAALGAAAALPRPALAQEPGRGAGRSFLVMIDPGHGGSDPGAVGQRGTQEKDVVLDIALEMERRLTQDHGVATVLTRDDDRFLGLADRVSLARTARVDLFVSVHADSAPVRQARGLSAYTLSAKATDTFAGALARQENSADRLGMSELAALKPEVQAILIDLVARHTRHASLAAREAIVRGSGHDLRLLGNPMRAADFLVLRAPDVPSVLVETGFLSNPQDEESLRSPELRSTIGRVLARELALALARAPFA
jgi:N-acetylmuramoyl-L-alanine amidase